MVAGRRPGAPIVGGAGLLPFLAVAAIGRAPRVVCDDAERAGFAEFRHYDGIDLRTDSG